MLAVGLWAEPATAENLGHVALIQHDGSPYASSPTVPNTLPREAAARAFYATHADAYDFLIVFPTFAFDLSWNQLETGGLHTLVRNEVTGIGMPVSAASGFGSRSRLKGYIDVHSLVPGAAQASADQALLTVAHEVAHQWSGRARFRDPGTGSASPALLGLDGSHWSYFLDSDGSVLYGGDWSTGGGGTFLAGPAPLRYSSLDLYLMGLLDPQEVEPLTLIRPTPGETRPAEALPPAPGESVTGTPERITVDQLIAAMGPRSPAAAEAQQVFRAGFAILAGPGQQPTAEQVAFVDQVRRAWANRFFFLTRGRAVMETDLVEPTPRQVSENPSVEQGLNWLLSAQRPDGSWADDATTVARETQLALQTLAQFGSAPGVATSVGRGADYLEALLPADVDTSARRALGLLAARPGWAADPFELHALTGASADGGMGLVPGYGSTIIDTVLALQAAEPGEPGRDPAVQFLLAAQRGDGGWGWTVGGPSDLVVTALTMEVLGKEERGFQVQNAGLAGVAYLRAARAWDGHYRDAEQARAHTAEVLLALDLWNATVAAEAPASAAALLALQWVDGSWDGSVQQTALTLRALRGLTLPNLVVHPGEVLLSASTVTEGVPVTARVLVRNLGAVDAAQVQVQAFDAQGRALSPAVVVPVVPAVWLATADLAIDTNGLGGSDQIFIVVDPAGSIDEKTKEDNRAAVALRVQGRPAGVDLFAAPGTVAVSPAVITRAGAAITVTGMVGNAGRTGAPDVLVVLRSGGLVVGSTVVSLPPAASQQITITGTLPRTLSTDLIELELDPGNVIVEAREDNNQVREALPVAPSVDLSVRAVMASPVPVTPGRDLTVTFQLVNDGLSDARGAVTSLSLLDASHTLLVRVPGPQLNVERGGAAEGSIVWRAAPAEAVLARVEVAYPGDADTTNNASSAPMGISSSALPNLAFGAMSFTTTPDPLDEGRLASAHVRLLNSGRATAGRFTVELWAGDPAAGGVRLASQEEDALLPGEERSASLSFQVPDGQSLAAVVLLDAGSRVEEFDETDNQLVVALEPRRRPDLVVMSGGIQPASLTPRQDEVVPVRVTVSNGGGQPTTAAPLAVFLGPPESGRLLGIGTVPPLAGGAQVELDFTWDTTGLESEYELVAVINGDGSAAEARTDNNRAVRAVAVQASNLALSEPYFSPNGDGVKDGTEVFFRYEGGAPDRVVVVDARGRVRRSLPMELAAGSGVAVWDGQDDAGKVVADDAYLISVERGALRLAATVVVVDDDRATVAQSPSEFLVQADLGTTARSTVPSNGWGTLVSLAGVFPDDDAALLQVTYYTGSGWTPTTHCRLFTEAVAGGAATRITTDGWRCPTYGDGVVLGPDGRSAYYTGLPDAVTGSALVRYDLQSGEAQRVLLTGSDGSLETWSPPVIGADAASLYIDTSGHVERVRLDEGGGSELTAWQSMPMFSPDGASGLQPIWGAHGIELHVFDAGGQGGRALVVAYPEPNCTRWSNSEEGCLEYEPTPIATPPGAVVLPEGSSLGAFGWLSPTEVVYVAGGLWRLDLSDARPELLVPAELLPGEPGSLIPSQDGRRLSLVVGDQVWTLDTADCSLELRYALPTETHYNLTVQASRSGRVHLTAKTVLRNNGLDEDQVGISTLANLGLRLAAIRRPGATAMQFRGTATDLNLESWELSVSPRGTPGSSILVASGAEPVLDGELAQWTPPAPGIWEARLTARDRAGNHRSVSTLASWTEVPAVANLRVAPRIFSPNGDGQLEAAVVTYSVQEPISTRLEIFSSSGALVRTIPLVHAQTGSYGVPWDGRDGAGQGLPDGLYRFTLGTERVEAELDSTSPLVSMRGTGEQHLAALSTTDAQFQYRPATGGGDCPPLTEAQKRRLKSPRETVPVLVAQASYRAEDDHLTRALFEAASAQSPMAFAPFAPVGATGGSSQPAAIRVADIPGAYLRLRATDAAANESLTQALEIPEALVVTGAGPGAYGIPECWGDVLVRGYAGTPFTGRTGAGSTPEAPPLGNPVYPPLQLVNTYEEGICPEPAVHMFGVEHTIRRPVLQWEVAYQLAGYSGWFVDSENVQVTDHHALIWDARHLPDYASAVQVRATDSDGRVFGLDVPVRCPLFDKATVVAEEACEVPAGLPTWSTVVVVEGTGADRFGFYLQDHETGARADVVATTTRLVETTDRQGNPIQVRTVEVQAALDQLPGCKYDLMSGVASMVGGSFAPIRSFDRCGLVARELKLQADALRVVLSETHVKPISWVDLFVSHGQVQQQVATLPAFEGTSAVAVASLAGLPCGVDLHVSARTHFADGTVRADELPSPGTCGTTSRRKSCTDVRLSATSLTPQLCSGRSEALSFVTSATSSEQTIQGIEIQLAAGGMPPFTLGTVAFQPGLSVSTSAYLPAGALPDGDYAAVARAVDLDGRQTDSSPLELRIDGTPPWMEVASPQAGAVVCPTLRSTPDGRRLRYVDVQGSVYDANLVGLGALFKCGAGQPQPARFLETGDSLLSVEVGSARGDCELVLEAHDRGGSYCSPSVPIHLVGNSGVTASAQPIVFSPNGDGVLDLTQVALGIDEDSSVTITGTDAAGRRGIALTATLPRGPSALPWDGTIGGVLAADGDARLDVSATDPCGAVATTSVVVKVDTTPPLVRIDAPLAGARIGGLAVVTGEVSDATFLDYLVELGDGPAPSGFRQVLHALQPAAGVIAEVPTAQLAAGTYSIRVTARDRAGNVSASVVVIEVAPKQLINLFSVAPALVSPNGDQRFDSSTAQFELLADATVQLELLDAAGTAVKLLQPPTPSPVGGGTVSLAQATLEGLPESSYALRLTASAAAIVEEETIPLIIDLARPTLAITEPAAAGSLRAAAPVIGSVQDVHLEAWSLTIRGAADDLELASGQASTAGVLGQLGALDEGEYLLRLTARDAAGNAAEVESALSVDRTQPDASFAAPLDGAWISGLPGAFDVMALVSDAHLESVTLDVSLAGGADVRIFEGGAPGPEQPLYAWSITPEMDGPAALTLRATDRAGNSSDATVELHLDSTLPTASIGSPRDTYLRPGEAIHGSASDENLASWTLELASGPPLETSLWGEVASGTWSSRLDGILTDLASLPADGLYSLRLTAVDLAGNTTVDVASFVVDSTPPLPPPALAAVPQGTGVALSWEPSPDQDVAFYQVLRSTGLGGAVEVGLPLPGLAFVDSAAPEGDLHYTVVAIDGAELRSTPSAQANLTIDRTPPQVALFRPADGTEVSGVVTVTGTAFSAGDFKEYRVAVGAGASPTVWTELRRSSLPILAGPLAELDAGRLQDGSAQTIRLQAEDVAGNVGEARVQVTIDGQPPAAPVLVSAVGSGSSVSLTWTAGGSPDVAGYLLLRNGSIANAPAGAPLADLRTYLLPPASLAYTDLALPDGTYTYEVQAFDRAGNPSALSNALSVEVEARPPQAVIVNPVNLARLRGPQELTASATDQDVARVQFEARLGGAVAFQPIGAPLTRVPYTTTLDLASLGGSLVEVRAVATDHHGNVDSAPASSFVFVAEPPQAPEPGARVDGADVTLLWSDPNPPGGVAGYQAWRDGQALAPAPTPSAGIATASGSTGTASLAIDRRSYTAWATAKVGTPWWQVVYPQAVLAQAISLQTYTSSDVEVAVAVNGVWVPVQRAAVNGVGTVSLSPPLAIGGVRVTFRSSTAATVGLYEVSVDQVPLLLTTPVVDAGLSDGDHAYRVAVVTPHGLSSEGSARATVYAPSLETPPSPVATALVRVSGAGASPGAVVSLRDGADAVASGVAAQDGRFAVDVPLMRGDNVLTAIATDGQGNRSRPSGPVTVVFDPPPDARLALTLEGVAGSSVSLAFVAEGDTSGATGIHVLRTSGGTSTLAATLPPGARVYIDEHVPNGVHTYRVVYFNASGFEGEPSNQVAATVEVALPPAPTGPRVSVLAGGGALRLDWSFPGEFGRGFLVERAIGPGGPFVVVNGDQPARSLAYVDRGLSNGTEYFYRVRDIDLSGNLGPPSPVASGRPGDALAPERPRFDTPTWPNQGIEVASERIDLGGLAEPGVLVEVRRAGDFVGESTAGPLEFLADRLYVDAGATTFGVTSDGHRLVVGDQWGSTSNLLLLEEWRSTELVAPDATGFGRVVFSPDGTRVAFEATSTADGRRHVWHCTAADGACAALGTDATEERSPTWLADGASLAYERTDASSGDLTLGVLALVTGSERRIAIQGRALGSPVGLPDGTLLAAAWDAGLSSTVLLQLRPDGGVAREVATIQGGVDGLTVSPNGAWAAIVAGSPSAVSLIDLVSGQALPVSSGQGVQRLPVFTTGGRTMAYLQDGVLTLHDLTTGLQEPLGAVGPLDGLYAADGVLFGLVQGVQVDQYRWGGRFTIPAARLVPGENWFDAVAADAFGNRSPPAEPIQVSYAGGELADLAVSAVLRPALPVAGDGAEAMVTVRNLGARRAPRSSLQLRCEDPAGAEVISTTLSLASLEPGSSTVAIVPLRPVAGGRHRLLAVVDPGGSIEDADRSNNQSAVAFMVSASRMAGIAVTAQPDAIAAGGVVTAAVEVVNPGAPTEATVRVRLEDASGAPVIEAPEAMLTPLQNGTTTLGRTLPVETLLAGSYQVAAEVVIGGQLQARATAPVTVLPELAVTLALVPDRYTLTGGATLTLAATVENLSRNAPLEGAELLVVVERPDGAVEHQVPAIPVPGIWPGLSHALPAEVQTAGLAVGGYVARASIVLDGMVVAEQTVAFEVAAEPFLTASLQVGAAAPVPAPPSFRAGVDVNVTALVSNVGGASATAVAARLALVSAGGQAVLWSGEVAFGDLAPGGTRPAAWSVPTVGLPRGTYGLSLGVTHDGVTEVMATARFRIIDGEPPSIQVVAPAQGAIVRDAVPLTVTARDDAAGVAGVVVAVDGVSVPLSHLDGSALAGTWSAPAVLGADGPHQLVISASDLDGNDGLVTPGAANPVVVNVVRDTVAPLLAIGDVLDGALVRTPVTPTIQGSDLHLAGVSALLNGAPFVAGTTIAADDTYTLSAQAVDAAGNVSTASVAFAIDRTPPTISVLGVPDGLCTAGDVAPLVLVTDRNPGWQQVVLDGAPFSEGSTVAAEGWHSLQVHAVDAAGNAAETMVSFCVDRTPPELSVAGVVEGQVSPVALEPAFSASDVNLVLVKATLDGAPFASGSPVRALGQHVLVVEALDAAGNRTQRTVPFTIRVVLPAVAITPQDGSFHAGPVTPSWSVTDAEPGTVVATVDGLPAAPGAPVTAEGRHVVNVSASNLAGGVEVASAFTIDLTPPTIALAGVSGDQVVRGPVVVAATMTETNLASRTLTLDGAAYAGEPVTAEGPHLVEATAIDRAGHTASASLRFTIDVTPPAIVVSGVRDGDLLGADVLPVVTITDANPGTDQLTLDGAPWSSGTVVTSEGPHRLEVTASDAAGNPSSATVAFELDKSAPAIQVGGVVDGAVLYRAVEPTFAATDAHLASTSATLDGQPFASGSAVTTGGSHVLVVAALDSLGHRAEKTVRFTLQLERPVVALAPPDGSFHRGEVVPAWTVTSADPPTVAATLDGAPLQSGTVVTTEGLHTLRVEASNGTGTTTAVTTFIIDRTPPDVLVMGVAEGDLLNASVLPEVAAADANLASQEVTLDGVTWLPGQVVADEGGHVLTVRATDLAGNEAIVAVRFELDLTPPNISTSVTSGGEYPAPVAVEFSATDLNLGTVEATLDGAPVVSGALVTESGAHVLLVTARDRAGNSATRAVTFTVNQPSVRQYVVDKTVAARQSRVMALVLGMNLDAEDTRRARSFLESAVPPGGTLDVAEDAQDFLAGLRSGRHNVYVLLQPWSEGGGGEPSSPRHVRLDDEAEAELTEAVYRGAGLVVAKARTDQWPVLQEATGVRWHGQAGEGNVVVAATAIGPARTLWAPGGVVLETLQAIPVASYGDRHQSHCVGNSTKTAAALRSLGLGATVTMGFDPSTAGVAKDARDLTSGAIAYVTPEASLEPLGVVEVHLQVQNQGPAVTTRVREALGEGLAAERILDGGAPLAASGVEWTFAQEAGGTDLVRYLLRLPAQAGTYRTEAEVAELALAGPVPAGTWPLELVVAQGEAELLQAARSLATALPTKGSAGAARRTILAALASVESNPGATTEDREHAIEDLLDAAEAAKTITCTEPNSLRLAVDRLLGIWEARQ